MITKFNQNEFKNELEDFISRLSDANEDRELIPVYSDFLPLMFREYLTSEWFAQASPDRKRVWVDQYDHLQYVLKTLEEFISKYSGEIKILDMKVEYKEPQLEMA